MSVCDLHKPVQKEKNNRSSSRRVRVGGRPLFVLLKALEGF